MHAFLPCSLAEELAETLGHRPRFAAADGAAIDAGNGGQFAHGAGAEHLVGPIDLCQREVALGMRNGVLAAELKHHGPRDALRTGDGARRGYLAAPRCNGVEVLSVPDGNEVTTIVRWSSPEAHEQALQSVDAAHFFKAVMTLASGPPDVRKYQPTVTC